MPHKDPEQAKAYHKVYREKHKEKAAAYMAIWNKEHKEDRQQYNKEYHSQDTVKVRRKERDMGRSEEKKEYNKLYSREYRKTDKGKTSAKKGSLKFHYSMSLDDFDALIKKQNNRCAICFKTFDPSSKATAACVDHIHGTTKVRGLLCKDCNTGIGHLKENLQIMMNAINYLFPYSDGKS